MGGGYRKEILFMAKWKETYTLNKTRLRESLELTEEQKKKLEEVYNFASKQLSHGRPGYDSLVFDRCYGGNMGISLVLDTLKIPYEITDEFEIENGTFGVLHIL